MGRTIYRIYNRKEFKLFVPYHRRQLTIDHRFLSFAEEVVRVIICLGLQKDPLDQPLCVDLVPSPPWRYSRTYQDHVSVPSITLKGLICLCSCTDVDGGINPQCVVDWIIVSCRDRNLTGHKRVLPIDRTLSKILLFGYTVPQYLMVRSHVTKSSPSVLLDILFGSRTPVDISILPDLNVHVRQL